MSLISRCQAAARKAAIFLTIVCFGFGSTIDLAVAQSQAQRGVEVAQQAQQRSSDAIGRANAAQQRAIAASERSVSAQDRASTAVETASSALERASAASENASQSAANALDLARSARFGGANQQTLSERYQSLSEISPASIELVDGDAAVRGQVIAIDLDDATLSLAIELGFSSISQEIIEGIDLRVTTLRVPEGWSIAEALRELRKTSGNALFSANHLHVQSSSVQADRSNVPLARSSTISGPAIGLIDGGVAENRYVTRIFQRGFAEGAPRADPHATALASLASGRGGVKSAAPGAPLLVADVYGDDPAGGNALAIARAMGWMARREVPIVIIGLVGPDNPIVQKAAENLAASGTIIVSPVGNEGAAAPPMYPAAYPAVIGVTGVDHRNRALVEAGRGEHVEFAAPGAQIRGASISGGLVELRGTSFAAPLVAGQLWRNRNAANPKIALEQQVEDLGPAGRDTTFGHGLICGTCR